MCPITKDGLQRMMVDAALRLRREAGSLRAEGMEFLIAARESILLGDFDGAKNAIRNALSVFHPLWKTERFKRSSW